MYNPLTLLKLKQIPAGRTNRLIIKIILVRKTNLTPLPKQMAP